MVIKHFVGSVSLTDNKASLDVTANIEEFRDGAKNYCDPVYFININPYNKVSVHMSLNTIEARALSHAVALVAYGKLQNYTKQSGGNTSLCHLNVYLRKEYGYIGLIRGENNAEFSFKPYELIAFAKELDILANTTSDALFKTQQMIQRRKNKAKKEKEQ